MPSYVLSHLTSPHFTPFFFLLYLNVVADCRYFSDFRFGQDSLYLMLISNRSCIKHSAASRFVRSFRLFPISSRPTHLASLLYTIPIHSIPLLRFNPILIPSASFIVHPLSKRPPPRPQTRQPPRQRRLRTQNMRFRSRSRVHSRSRQSTTPGCRRKQQ
jgi:hypothetical protein